MKRQLDFGHNAITLHLTKRLVLVLFCFCLFPLIFWTIDYAGFEISIYTNHEFCIILDFIPGPSSLAISIAFL